MYATCDLSLTLQLLFAWFQWGAKPYSVRDTPDHEPPELDRTGEEAPDLDAVALSRSDDVGMGRFSGLGDVWKPGAVFWMWTAGISLNCPELLDIVGEDGPEEALSELYDLPALLLTLLRFFLWPSGEDTSDLYLLSVDTLPGCLGCFIVVEERGAEVMRLSAKPVSKKCTSSRPKPAEGASTGLLSHAATRSSMRWSASPAQKRLEAAGGNGITAQVILIGV